jgi:hypothetical protein
MHYLGLWGGGGPGHSWALKGLTDLPVCVRDEHVKLVLREPAVLLAQLHVRHDGGHLTVELLPALLHCTE